MVKRWSPVSFTGTVYEFNRGVICIGKDKTQKGSLDQNKFHHDEATILLITSLLPVNNLDNNQKAEVEKTLLSFVGKPFEAGIFASQLSNVLIQLEGDEVLVFLPNEINEYQLKELYEIVLPRKHFNYSIHFKGQIYDNISYQDIMIILTEYGKNKIDLSKKEFDKNIVYYK